MSISVRRLCVTGTPGVGKTTVSLRLAEAIGVRYIDLGDLVIRRGWICGYNYARKSFVVDDKLQNQLKRYLIEVREYVIDTHYCELIPSECIDVVVVLRFNPKLLFERLSKRGYGIRKICENTLAELLDYCLIAAIEAHGKDKVIEVDATGKKADDIVNEILRVASRGERKVGVVNWLQEVDSEFLSKLEQGLE